MVVRLFWNFFFFVLIKMAKHYMQCCCAIIWLWKVWGFCLYYNLFLQITLLRMHSLFGFSRLIIGKKQINFNVFFTLSLCYLQWALSKRALMVKNFSSKIFLQLHILSGTLQYLWFVYKMKGILIPLKYDCFDAVYS